MGLVNIFKTTLLLVFLGANTINCQKNPYFQEGRTTIVHLFEWKWKDIAAECENFLGPKGFAGVQISPPNENVIVSDRNWWERYQPVSYILNTRSGSEEEFIDMIKRCKASGVVIYVDAVINHMAALDGKGTAGSTSHANDKQFPAVPYGPGDFNPSCSVNNYQDADNVRNCELVGLKDLNQGTDWVREKIIEYFDHCIELGVAGFRVDAAKHMWPGDLGAIYGGVKNVQFGGPPFIYQEVIDLGGEAVKKEEYTGIGTVLEFKYGKSLGNVFRGNDKLTYLHNFGPEWGLIDDGRDAVVFIDNHDNQRTDPIILTYKQPKQYKMAIAFMQSWNYGITRVMSSFNFDNNDQGPPHDGNMNILSPTFNDDGTCGNGWVCEHRWRQIYNMVGFKNAVEGTAVNNWWSNNDQQIAFGRGNKGFIAFTNNGDLNQDLATEMPDGTYCDVISGELKNGKCTGKTLTVSNGMVHVQLGATEYDGVVAIHINSKV